MALICNTVQNILRDKTVNGESSKVDLDHERYIESGSAYFAQAFAEALGLVSDLELHNPERAGLRLQSMTFLLDHALKQYEDAVEFGSQTGLSEYHERRLRESGLNLAGSRQVLNEAQSRGFIRENGELVEMLAATFDRKGYSGLMSLYIGRVRELRDLIVDIGESEKLGADAVAWQELAWKLTTLFAQTLEVGKAIAILNILTFRLPASVLASDAQHLS
jgi:hypothetical protein